MIGRRSHVPSSVHHSHHDSNDSNDVQFSDVEDDVESQMRTRGKMLKKSFAISPPGRQALCPFNSGRFASSRSRLCFRQGDAIDAIFETENCIFIRTPNTTCLLGVKEPSFDAHRWLRMSISPTTPLDHHSIFFLKLSVYPGLKVEK